MTDSPFDRIIPRNLLLNVCGAIRLLVQHCRASSSANPEALEYHAQSFAQLDLFIADQLSRIALPDCTKVQAALQGVRDCREALLAGAATDNLAARVEALREAGERLKAVVDSWPSSPQLEELIDPLIAQAEDLKKLLAPAEPPPPPAPQEEASHRFKLKGQLWDVCYGTEHGFFPDSEGMRRIAKLLSCSGKPVPALDLVGGSEAIAKAEHTSQPVLDKEALRQYDKRLREVDADLAKAESNHDRGQVDQLSAEKDQILEQVRQATGVGGKDRSLGPSPLAVKAADAVRKTIERVYQKMEEATPPLPNLVAHFKSAIRPDGTSFLYGPTPPAPHWIL